MTTDLLEVLPVKDGDSQRPIPTAWRPTLTQVVEAFASDDFALARGVAGVEPVPAKIASQIRDYLADYGGTLVSLPTEAWDTSVCIWNGDHWSALVDLWTKEEGRSDLVLQVRISEAGAGFRTAVHLVYVP